VNNFTLQQWASVPVRGVQGAVPSRGVCVHDLPGTHRDEACFSTASQRSLKPRRETDPGRWSSETPFQALRAYLRLETPGAVPRPRGGGRPRAGSGCLRWWRCATPCCRPAPPAAPGALVRHERGDLLRRDHGRAPLGAGRRGFCHLRSPASLDKITLLSAESVALCPCPRRISEDENGKSRA